MPRYRVLSPLRRDGRRWLPGEEIELPAGVAAGIRPGVLESTEPAAENVRDEPAPRLARGRKR